MSGKSVLHLNTTNSMSNCNHEEADTRIIVHMHHALQQGLRRVEVRSVDTDVVIILVGVFYELLKTQSSADLWVAFGTGKNYRFLHINAICDSLGEPKSRALPVFHAITGCDTISAFKFKGKKTAWQAWQAFEEVTDTFVYLSIYPFENLNPDSCHFKALERLVVVMYDRTSPLTSINEAREELFCKRRLSVERMPPTQDVLLQHCKRSLYQAEIWTTSMQVQQMLPSPEDYSWTKTSNSWAPVWITIPDVSKACRELVKCSCKGNCSNCTCAKANIVCSPLYKCKCSH